MNQEINQTTPPQQEVAAGFITNELVTQFLEFFKAPVFEDEPEKTRVAGVLNPILLSLFAGISYIPINALIRDVTTSLSSIIIGVVILVPLAFALIAVRRGAVRRTATIFVTILFLMLVIFAGLFGRALNNPVFPGLMTVIFLAGILLGTRSAIIFGALSIGEVVALSMINQFAELPIVLETSDSTYYQSIILSMVLMAFYVYFGTRSYGKAFQQVAEAETSLRDSNKELEEIRTYLEQEVAENTRQLERRSRQLEAAAKVAGASISTQNLDEMLENVVNEVSRQFDFFHVGIFMLDEQKEWAALRAASSEGGKQMIARNHRLAVGRQGIVGFVTSLGQGRISQDTGGDRVHEPAEELPETRSEMALPLISRGEIIGALDIQDTNPDAFTEDDIDVLQTMADQIALAIENIRLFAQTQETLVEVQRLFGDYSQQAWHDVHKKNLLSSYRYFSGAVTKVDGDALSETTETTVSIPVEVRGVKLGAIEISKGEDDAKWSDDELKLLKSLSDQLGIALDSARLFNESQLRATTEHAISDINSQLWETMDINAILRTTAANLRETLALPELTIRMASPDEDSEVSSNGNLETDKIEVND
jgi:GAF domain-containing protein